MRYCRIIDLIPCMDYGVACVLHCFNSTAFYFGTVDHGNQTQNSHQISRYQPDIIGYLTPSVEGSPECPYFNHLIGR